MKKLSKNLSSKIFSPSVEYQNDRILGGLSFTDQKIAQLSIDPKIGLKSSTTSFKRRSQYFSIDKESSNRPTSFGMG